MPVRPLEHHSYVLFCELPAAFKFGNTITEASSHLRGWDWGHPNPGLLNFPMSTWKCPSIFTCFLSCLLVSKKDVSKVSLSSCPPPLQRLFFLSSPHFILFSTNMPSSPCLIQTISILLLLKLPSFSLSVSSGQLSQLALPPLYSLHSLSANSIQLTR